jgi:transcriptional regulator with XRE-family HTH domain
VSALAPFLSDQLKLRGWTQSEFARRCELSRQHVSRLLTEHGPITRRRLPSKETFAKIAKGLDISEATLRASISFSDTVEPRAPLTVESPEESTDHSAPSALSGQSTESLLAELQQRQDKLRAADATTAHHLVAVFSQIASATTTLLRTPGLEDATRQTVVDTAEPLYSQILGHLKNLQRNGGPANTYRSLLEEMNHHHTKLVAAHSQSKK